MNRIDELYNESGDCGSFSHNYCKYLHDLMSAIDHKQVHAIVDVMLDAEKKGKTIFFLGNGGSATTADHFAADLAKSAKSQGYGFKTKSLTELASLTAYANDEGYERVFSGQLENVAQEGDIIVVISASGNSKNLLSAVEYAKSIKAKTIGLLGFDGGALKEMVDIPLVISTRKGEYEPVEDAHMILHHIMTAYICRAAKPK